MPRRVVVLGHSVSALVCALESRSCGHYVDMVFEAESIPSNAHVAPPAGSQAEDAELEKLCMEFLGKFGLSLSEGGVHGKQLLKLLNTCPTSEVRFLHKQVVQSLIKSPKDVARGVHAEKSGSKKPNHSCHFGDYVVATTSQPIRLAKEMEQLYKAAAQGFYDANCLVVLPSDTEMSAYSIIGVAVKAARAIARKLAQLEVDVPIPHHEDWIDRNGETHQTALSPTKWVPLTLENRVQLNKTNHLFRFKLPNATDQTGLLCGQFVAVKLPEPGSETKEAGARKDIVRYYSPVSRNEDFGHLDLLVKIDPERNFSKAAYTMTGQLQNLAISESISFLAPAGGFEYHRNTYREVGMIAGGTGITPMIQILRSVAMHAEDSTQVRLLYCNEKEDDILCREELMYWSSARQNIHVQISLAEAPEQWSMETGYATQEMVRTYLPEPARDVIILTCGPPPMIKAVMGMLQKEGHHPSRIFDFLAPKKKVVLSHFPVPKVSKL